MKRYVLGFAFYPGGECLLMRRKKMDWQEGRYNGLGGKIEGEETPVEAMVREFKEESGVATHTKHWEWACTLRHPQKGNEWELHCFRARLDYEKLPKAPVIRDEGHVENWTSPPPTMEQTARWLYWLCRDDSTFGLPLKGGPDEN